jgi:hypothetical protein
MYHYRKDVNLGRLVQDIQDEMLSEFLYFTALTTPPLPWNNMAGISIVFRGFSRATSRK